MFAHFIRRRFPSFTPAFARQSTLTNHQCKRDYCNRHCKGKHETTRCVDVLQCPWFDKCLKLFTAVSVVAGGSTLRDHFCTAADRSNLKARARYSFLQHWLLLAGPTNEIALGVLPKSGVKLDGVSSLSRAKAANYVDAFIRDLGVQSTEYWNNFYNLLGMAYLQLNKPNEAIDHLKKCNNFSKAFFNLGAIYETGLHNSNRQPDYDKAKHYYSLASSLHHKDATYNLALIYLYGKGDLPVNMDEGAKLLRKAADLGVDEAKEYFEEDKNSVTESPTECRITYEKVEKLISSASVPNLVSYGTIGIGKTLQRKPSLHEIGSYDLYNSNTNDILLLDVSHNQQFGSRNSLEICFSEA